MDEHFARDLVGVLCLQPRNLSSYNFTAHDVLEMTVADALHYYEEITRTWKREIQAIRAARRKR